MAGRLFNLAKMNTSTTGTGTITLSTAVSGFLSFAAAGVANGQSVTYIIEDGANRELGTGTYTSSGTTLTRSVIKSTNSDAAINLSGSATVGITAAAENFTEWNGTVDANGFSIGFDDNTGINDDSGNETVRFRKTSSAVNYVEIINTETTVGPQIAAAGDDTNIDLRLAAKGTGRVQIPNATLTTPALGTPASGTLTNCTGLPTAGLLNDAVTYAKMQNVSAASRILGRGSAAGAGDVQELSPGSHFEISSTTINGNKAPTIQVFTSSGTWTKPTGCRFIRVTVTGSGGGGGAVDGTASQFAGGSGGGAGATAIAWFNVSSNSNSGTVTVAAGGAGGAAGANNGVAGGTSSFALTGAGTLTCPGGGAGFSQTAGTSLAMTSGGSKSGAATGGHVNVAGGGGQPSIRLSGSVGRGGTGAPSFWGGGGSSALDAAGGAGGAYGAGGGGGSSRDATDYAGGDGGDGICIVEEFY